MQDNEASAAPSLRRVPWNESKLVGAKPPLRPKHVWSIRTKLQVTHRKRDLAASWAGRQFIRHSGHYLRHRGARLADLNNLASSH
jgi:hypothetical protein